MPKSRNLRQALNGYQSVVARREAEKKAQDARDRKAKSATGSGPDKKERRRERERERERELMLEQRRLDKEAAKGGKVQAAAPPAPGKGKRKATYPFFPDDTILLVGEANFSFAHALVVSHGHPAHQILATSYDTEEVCYEKYPDARGFVQRLRQAGAGVAFEVDARYLERHRPVTHGLGEESSTSKFKAKRAGGEKWSKIVFNFPHVGAGIKDQDRNILSNQEMLLAFYRSAAGQLTDGPARFKVHGKGGAPGAKSGKRKRGAEEEDDEEDALDQIKEVEEDMRREMSDEGEALSAEEITPTTATKSFSPPHKQGTLLLTLRTSSPYSLWDAPRLATRPPRSPATPLSAHAAVQPRYAAVRSFAFDPALYPGYEHRRTLGFKEGVSKGGNEEILRAAEGKGARTWEFALRHDAEE